MRRLMRVDHLFLAVGVALTLLLFGLPSEAAAAVPPPSVIRQGVCQFRLGFKAIQEQISSTVGQCLENEHHNPANGDALQQTTKGMLAWRKSDNFTAFTDGHRSWVNGPNGLQSRLNTERFSWERDPVTTASAPARPATATAPPPAPVPAAPVGARPAPAPAAAPKPEIIAPAAPRPATPPISTPQPQATTAPGRPPSSPTTTSTTPSGHRITTSYIFDVVNEPSPSKPGGYTCLKRNPSCDRDDWWAEWNELQDTELVQYRFLKPGLVTEGRFIEAVWLLWLWPEGKELLRSAADHGVIIVTDPDIKRSSFAGYSAALRRIRFNHNFTETSTWMVAAVLAHELKHADDDRKGLRAGSGFTDCIAREQEAYKVEARYARWLYDWMDGYPSPDMVRKSLSDEDYFLYSNLLSIAASRDPSREAFEDYRQQCSR